MPGVVASAQVCGGFDQIQLTGRACFPWGGPRRKTAGGWGWEPGLRFQSCTDDACNWPAGLLFFRMPCRQVLASALPFRLIITFRLEAGGWVGVGVDVGV